MTFRTAAELCLILAADRQNRIRFGWGNWEYRAHNLTLFHVEHRYEIDLERCATSAQILDWIFQISSKDWGTEDVATLIQAFDDLLAPQRFICSVGRERGPIDVRAVIERKNSR